jgi:hypothetical protein
MYCFSMNTYFAALDQQIPPVEGDQRYRNVVNYYIWTPFFLGLVVFTLLNPFSLFLK